MAQLPRDCEANSALVHFGLVSPPFSEQDCGTLPLRPELKSKCCTSANENVLAIYPGSFDPVTNGHLDLIERGAKIFDRLIVSSPAQLRERAAVHAGRARGNAARSHAALAQRRSGRLQRAAGGLRAPREANVILRGIRAVSDYEYELQMAMMNRKLEAGSGNGLHDAGGGLQLSEFAPGARNCAARRPITGLVPPVVEERLRAKVS